MEDQRGCRPEITYPCLWQYRIIGSDRAAMHQAIAATVAASAGTVTEGNVSSGGRYISLSLAVMVKTEAERLLIYQLLAGHPAVRMVL